jgi:uncharacterized protein YecE (DUF72 family)
VYSKARGINYLSEYARRCDTVEIDQWFWSLFGAETVLTKPEVVKEYASSVPEDFTLTVKAPNSITLTHFYKSPKGEPMRPNPDFFSIRLANEFLETLEPIGSKIGMLMFQFEYLNMEKMGSQRAFLSQLKHFISGLPKGFGYAIETRNPNYLNREYFTFLAETGVSHVFLRDTICRTSSKSTRGSENFCAEPWLCAFTAEGGKR